MTLKNNRASLLCHFKLYASFHSHQWIKILFTVRKCSNRVKFDNFLHPVTLKFQESPWKTIGHLFYTHSSFIHRFIAINEIRFQLQSANAQTASNLRIFCLLWPWHFTDDLQQGKSEGFDSCDRPSNLTQIGVNSLIFQPMWSWNLMDDPEKQ